MDIPIEGVITGFITHTYFEPQNYSITYSQAINLKGGAIRLSSDLTPCSLFIDNSFFFNDFSENHGGAIYFDSNATFEVIQTCAKLCSTCSYDYEGSFSYSQNFYTSFFNFTSFVSCGSCEKPSKSSFFASGENALYQHHNSSFSSSICANIQCSGSGYMEYSSFSNNNLSNPEVDCCIFQKYLNTKFCNFIENLIANSTENSCIYFSYRSPNNILSNSCFFRNRAKYLASATDNFKLFECFSDCGDFNNVNAIGIRKAAITLEINLLYTYECDADFPTIAARDISFFEPDLLPTLEDPVSISETPTFSTTSPTSFNKIEKNSGNQDEAKQRIILIAASAIDSVLIITFIIVFVIYMVRKAGRPIEQKEITYSTDTSYENEESKDKFPEKSKKPLDNVKVKDQKSSDDESYSYTYTYSYDNKINSEETNDKDISISDEST
ncbi:hypothetical protein TVAG_014060 [Trichomonas vaginalis G3]|uniref:Uncharacterized protein n=1 Tax=Trichomonas vaginalis (strain ATCC PRA-98 / G3) TaxID=412133 RepID=A2DDG0_TRIV3|nr:hypothetical protein TVAGG3_0986210 [Trichomonas vaginalis G3]EAY21639.1 hypothetical protein TVAG_014060 [Trichomonas vaginalis G3]KAI5489685.1 hypothetical protein TVAGG3_0986210 [Trichomonas vaginalis G3]|eukprot:XP_001582625.1 hypothetical protein [Trichomonas vaginalis G3]